MTNIAADEIIGRNVRLLSETDDAERRMTPPGEGPLPSVAALDDFIDSVRTVIFPEFFDRRRSMRSLRPAVIGTKVEKIFTILGSEIAKGFQLEGRSSCDEATDRSRRLALDFIDRLPEIKRLLYTDVQALFNNDPAADDYSEIILSYPAVQAMINYRSAHALLELGIPVIPRVLTELAHSATGIDINPGARIGEYFAIDHGTGIVIGQTAIIGRHVTLYQGVTLGARKFSLDESGLPVNVPRHPIIEDNVTVYSNASILGRITVGHDSIIGGNVWLTESVAPHSKVLQSPQTTVSNLKN
ncbi:MAG: serine O-acetyltransferase [Muribaculaceae bacterium]|nr:serine O-acetyltransferase [Muribaculaceae bacterium]